MTNWIDRQRKDAVDGTAKPQGKSYIQTEMKEIHS